MDTQLGNIVAEVSKASKQTYLCTYQSYAIILTWFPYFRAFCHPVTLLFILSASLNDCLLDLMLRWKTWGKWYCFTKTLHTYIYGKSEHTNETVHHTQGHRARTTLMLWVAWNVYYCILPAADSDGLPQFSFKPPLSNNLSAYQQMCI